MSLKNLLAQDISDQERGAIILQHAKDYRALKTLIGNMKNESPFIRAAIAQAMGIRGSRAVHEPLKEMIQDQDELVREDALLALGTSRDSRVLFCYANLWQSKPELRQRIILGLEALCDPRSPPFIDLILRDIEGEEYPVFEASEATIKASEEALKNIDKAIILKNQNDLKRFFKNL